MYKRNLYKFVIRNSIGTLVSYIVHRLIHCSIRTVNICTYKCMYVCACEDYAHVYVCGCVYVYDFVHVYMHILHVQLHALICVHTCICVCAGAYVRVYMYI